jgi:Co/Zn/Cd efflux system component
MTKLAMTFIFGGILMMFGAVGGMEDPSKADYFFQQIVIAVVGVFFAIVGTVLLPEERDYE